MKSPHRGKQKREKSQKSMIIIFFLFFSFRWVMGTRTTPLSLYNSVYKCCWPRPLLPPPAPGSKQVLQLLRDNLFMNTHRVKDPPTHTRHKCNPHAHMHTRAVASGTAKSHLNSTRVSNTHKGQRWGRSWHHLLAGGLLPPDLPRSSNSRSSKKQNQKAYKQKNTTKQKQNTHKKRLYLRASERASERPRLVQFHPRRSDLSRSRSRMRLQRVKNMGCVCVNVFTARVSVFVCQD